MNRLLKKTHMLRCAQSSRSNVHTEYACARRVFARLASEIFLSSLFSKPWFLRERFAMPNL